MTLTPSRRRIRNRSLLARSLFEPLEPRRLLAADPSFLVHWQGDMLQSYTTNLGPTLRPSQTSSLAGTIYNGLASVGEYGGGTASDRRIAFTFDDNTPLSPPVGTIDGGVYNGASANFYGALIGTSFNSVTSNSFADEGLNDSGVTDNVAIRYQPSTTGTGTQFDTVFYWKKSDFLTNSAAPISLDPQRAYFKVDFTHLGNLTGRWLVRNGNQFYVSKDRIIGANDGTAYNSRLQGPTLVNELWAPYNPAATDVHFDANNATFATPTSAFTDVSAIGFIAQRNYNELQTVTTTGTLTGGTFKISFNGKTTAAIAYNATVATILTSLNNTFGKGIITPGGTDITNLTLSFSDPSNAFTDVPMASVDTSALTGTAIVSTVAETTKGGSVLYTDKGYPGAMWVGFTDVEFSASGRTDGDNLNIDTASYLGGNSGTSILNAVTIEPDGTILIAGTLANDPPGVVPLNLLGGGAGTILHLNAAATQVLGITHLGTGISDMQVGADGHIVVAAAGIGLVVLNSAATAVLWSDTMTTVNRVSVGSDGIVAALSTGLLLKTYNAAGTLLGSKQFGDSAIADVTVDGTDHSVIVAGTNYKHYSSTVPVLGGTPVKVPFIRSYAYDFSALYWRDYDWAADTTAYDQNNSLSDSTSDRITMGADGMLYVGAHADGGASTYRYDPQISTLLLTGSQLVSIDTYTQATGFSGAAHPTFIARYNPATGAIDKGQWEVTRLSNGTANSVTVLDIAADSLGRTFVTGAQAFQAANRNGLAINDIALAPYNGFEAFALVLNPAFTSRQTWVPFAVGDPSLPNNPDAHGSNGNAIAIGPSGQAVLVGQIYKGQAFTTANAIQPTVPGSRVGGANAVAATGYLVRWSPPPLAPNAPTKLTAVASTSYEVALTWQINAGNVSGYRIERSLDGVNFSQIALLATPGVSGWWDETADASTTYSYRILAYSSTGDSLYSNVASLTTPAPNRGAFFARLVQNNDIGVGGSSSFDPSTYKYTQIMNATPGGALARGQSYNGLLQKLHGDGEIVVHRAAGSTAPGSFDNLGILLQESLVRGSKANVASIVTTQGNVALNSWNGTTQTTVGAAVSHTTYPWWKLSRVGNTFTGYYSANGSAWLTFGSFSLTMPADLFVAIGLQGRQSNFTAAFDSVAVSHLGGGDFSATHDETPYLRAGAAKPGYSELYANLAGPPTGLPTYLVLTTALQNIIVDSAAGNDTLTVDFAAGNPLPAGGLALDGGAHSLADTLKIIGSSPADPISATATQITRGSAVITYANTETLSFNSGAFTVPSDLAGKNVIANAATSFTATQHLGALTIAAATTVTLPAAAQHHVLIATQLNIDPTARLDLATNDFVLDYTNSTSPIAAITALVSSAYNNGTWSGPGITSTSALANPGTYALGYVDNNTLAPPFSTFGGVAVPARSVLVKFTYVADLNLDGLVSAADASIFGTNYSAGSATIRYLGDLNYNGTFDAGDASKFGTAYDASLPQL